MTTFTHALRPLTLPPDARIFQPPRAPAEPLTPDAPALAAMTDLRRTRVITTTADARAAAALDLMIHAKVRLLVVIDPAGMITGLVSAQDLMGDKPLRVANAERIRHDQVTVAQVMTPVGSIQPLDIRDVGHATVRDIAAHLIASHRQHALVIEASDGRGGYTACGIFSATQIGRQLGQDIDLGDGRAESFSELRRLIA
jgi:CBS domain-containing protein